MNSSDEAFDALLHPVRDTLTSWGLTWRSSVGTLGIGLILLSIIFWGKGRRIKCADMDGMPMKVMNVSPKAAALFMPQVSILGEQLAQDEPYLIRDGNYEEVVIHTAEHVREFLRKDSKDHFRPKNLGFGDYFYRVLGQCVGAVNGEQWRMIRSYFDPAYTHKASLSMVPFFRAEVSKWLTTLKNDSLRSGVGRFVLHAPTSCKELTLRVIPRSFYGDCYDDEAADDMIRISKLQGPVLKDAITGRWQKYSWYNKLPTRSRRQLDTYKRDWRAFNMDILASAREQGLTIPAEHAFSGVQPNNEMSLEQYLQTVDEMLFTNIDITGIILAHMLNELAKHQDFQQRLFDEMRAWQSKEGHDADTYLGSQNTLLHYLVLETLRLRPATYYSVPECIAVDKVIGRYKIPAKTPVVIDVRRLNTSALTWGPDGSEFRPERFQTLSPNEYRYGFMRFGVASGKCMGKHMAELLMKVAMVTVLNQYRVEDVEMNIGVKEGDLAFVKRQ